MNLRPNLSHARRAGLVSRSRQQQGAATLVVVMILFFIMAMMAAYANRNLIFEQRIASNYYRSGVAFEAADAGVEWTLAMLNGSNVDASCLTTGTVSDTFRQRYLTVNASTRAVGFTAPGGYDNPVAGCVRLAGAGAGTGWSCNCPAAQPWTPSNSIAAASQMQPSFQVGFLLGGRDGMIRIQSLGCSGSNPSNCELANDATAEQQMLGASFVQIQAALVSGLKSPPAMPLTVGQNVANGGGDLGLHNTDAQGNGMLLLAGGTATGLTRLDSLPGTPGTLALVEGDAALTAAATAPGSMFAMFFGMAPAAYQTQPAIRAASGCTTACDGTNITATLALGARMIWVEGTLDLTGNGTFGSAADPVIIIVNGAVTINGSVTVNGLLYAFGNISGGGGASVNGAVLGEGSFSSTGVMDINYQAAILQTLSNTRGSFVRVPGSWTEGIW